MKKLLLVASLVVLPISYIVADCTILNSTPPIPSNVQCEVGEYVEITEWNINTSPNRGCWRTMTRNCEAFVGRSWYIRGTARYNNKNRSAYIRVEDLQESAVRCSVGNYYYHCEPLPTCDENQTLDMSVTPPVCTNTCDQNDTKYLPEAPDNYAPDFTWTTPDRSQECRDKNGIVQSRTINCKEEHRCMLPSDAPIPCAESISSYVSPKGQLFHEDIAISGATFGLHYQSRFTAESTIAHGWGISSHHKLTDKGNLQLGSGSFIAPSHSYTESNHTVVVYGSGEYLFDANGTHLTTRDLTTKVTQTTFSYDVVGRLATITDVYGQMTTIDRDANGTVISITAPHGQMTYLSVDSQGDLVEVQYEDASSYAFEYDNHLMTQETEPNGNVFLHIFDAQGRVTKVIDAEQGTWHFGSGATDTHSSLTVTRASGDVTTYRNHYLNNDTRITERILPSGDVIRYENSADRSRASVTSCGTTTTKLYKENNGTLLTDPYTHDRILQSSTTTTPSGLSSVTTHNRTYDYQTNGDLKRITTTTTHNGKTTTHKHNLKRHRDITITPEGKEHRITYDASMRLPLTVNPYGYKKTAYTYDDKGRVTQATTGSRVTTYGYDNRGNLATITDPLQRTTTYSYDSRDRLIQTTHPDTTTEHYTYDSNGNLITRTIPTPADHTFTYNGVNKRVATTSPLGSATTYTYDKQRRVTKVTKPGGKSIDTIYTNGRVTAITTPEGTTNYSYVCQSNIANITKGSESFSFTYDGTLLTNITQAGILNHTIAYAYTNDFAPSSMTYAGKTTNYLYNNDSELTQAGNYTITREKKGRKVITTDGTYSLLTKVNRYGELRKREDNTLKVKLFRNDVGQIVKKTEKLKDKRRVVYRYSYDERGRLTKVKKGRKTVEEYSYDDNGNRASAAVNGTTTVASYTLDDQIVNYGDNSYAYNDDGYLESKATPEGTTVYTYGTMGELIRVVTPTKTITYHHNANNQRVAKEVNGTIVEKYLWGDLTTLLAVYDANDNLVQQFEYANQRMPLSMIMGATKYYLHYDQVGSLRVVSRVLSPDNTLEVVKEITYDTYGNILTDSNTSLKVPFGFAGGLYDSDTKLTRFGYRDYDAFTGKWTAKDPIGFDGGDSNLYGYVLGDPVGFVDPTGEFALPLILPFVPAIKTGVEALIYTAALYFIGNTLYDVCEAEEDDKAKTCAEEHKRAEKICLKHYGDPDWFGITGKYYSLEHCKMGLISQRCGGNKVD